MGSIRKDKNYKNPVYIAENYIDTTTAFVAPIIADNGTPNIQTMEDIMDKTSINESSIDERFVIRTKNRCCGGNDTLKVAPLVRWCGNCGSIYSAWTRYKNISPNLHVCATCKHWGPDGEGAGRRCHLDDEEWHTSAGSSCKYHSPVNPCIPL